MSNKLKQAGLPRKKNARKRIACSCIKCEASQPWAWSYPRLRLQSNHSNALRRGHHPSPQILTRRCRGMRWLSGSVWSDPNRFREPGKRLPSPQIYVFPTAIRIPSLGFTLSPWIAYWGFHFRRGWDCERRIWRRAASSPIVVQRGIPPTSSWRFRRSRRRPIAGGGCERRSGTEIEIFARFS